MTDLTTEKRGKLREQSSRAPWGVWIDIRPEDLLALLDAADERDKLVANPRDEYHTMEELYEYRMLYNALAANAMPDRAVKSWRHSDGEMCFGGGWFVVYLHLPTGQVSNHYKAEHWDLFRVPEVDIAPEWDGHTTAVAADRLRLAAADLTAHDAEIRAQALAPIREALAGHPRCDIHPDGDSITCGWKHAVASVQAVLDADEVRAAATHCPDGVPDAEFDR